MEKETQGKAFNIAAGSSSFGQAYIYIYRAFTIFKAMTTMDGVLGLGLRF